MGFAVGAGVGAAVGLGVAAGFGVAVGAGFAVGAAVGTGEAAGEGFGVWTGVDVGAGERPSEAPGRVSDTAGETVGSFVCSTAAGSSGLSVASGALTVSSAGSAVSCVSVPDTVGSAEGCVSGMDTVGCVTGCVSVPDTGSSVLLPQPPSPKHPASMAAHSRIIITLCLIQSPPEKHRYFYHSLYKSYVLLSNTSGQIYSLYIWKGTIMSMKKIRNCTKETVGIITDLLIRGQDYPTRISVTYTVEGHSYTINDTVKLKSEKIKLGFLTIGQKRVPTLNDERIGSQVRVQYNPRNPAEAYLPDNTGKANI